MCPKTRTAGEFFDRLHERYEINPISLCWEWSGAKNLAGYGKVTWSGKTIAAHRAFWEQYNGPAGDACVLHRCDNPACVNPDHLFLGSQSDNVRDMDDKGRRVVGFAAGERCHLAKLTEADVVEIRRLGGGGGLRQKDIAAMFGVSQPLVGLIVRREIWRHVSA